VEAFAYDILKRHWISVNVKLRSQELALKDYLGRPEVVDFRSRPHRIGIDLGKKQLRHTKNKPGNNSV
jgi:hypothetical protein